jgi:hypothetical protein
LQLRSCPHCYALLAVGCFAFRAEKSASACRDRRYGGAQSIIKVLRKICDKKNLFGENIGAVIFHEGKQRRVYTLSLPTITALTSKIEKLRQNETKPLSF